MCHCRTEVLWCSCAAFRLTHAVVTAVDLHVVSGADAGVVADRVVAKTGATDSRCFTLIDIFTDNRKIILFHMSYLHL